MPDPRLAAALAVTYTSATPVAPLPTPLEPWISGANVISVSIGLSVFILFYAVAVQNADDMVSTAHERLENLASTDPLTGLLNRRSMDDHLRRAVHSRQPAAVLLADIDRFKRINDNLGHDTGDLVIQAVSTVLQTGTRDEDPVARWGGEEFLILLNGHNQEAALAVAERLRQRVRQAWQGPEGYPLAISVGIATLRPTDTADTLVSRADRGLLQAKQLGRDRCAIACDPETESTTPCEATYTGNAGHT